MGVLITKSKENLSAAQLLIQNKYFSSSVHCAYYSSVQILLHLLKVKFRLSDEYIENEAKKTRSGSHVFAKNYVLNKMYEAGIRFEYTNLNRTLSALKYKREQADYKETTIDEAFSKAALREAEVVRDLLNRNFDLRI